MGLGCGAVVAVTLAVVEAAGRAGWLIPVKGVWQALRLNARRIGKKKNLVRFMGRTSLSWKGELILWLGLVLGGQEFADAPVCIL